MPTRLAESQKDLASKTNLLKWRSSFVGFLLFWINKEKLTAEVAELADEVRNLELAQELSQVDVTFDVAESERGAYREVDRTFRELINSQKVWDIVQEHDVDAVRARMQANVAIERKPVEFFVGTYPRHRNVEAP